jgi:ribonuclease-3
VIKQILRKIRLISNSKKEPYLLFRNILGFFPDNIEYYQLAIRHKSVPVKSRKNGQEVSNERLEFLGDAILNSVISDIIYKRFQDASEGYLTNIRAKIVSRDSLNRIAREIGLTKAVIASRYVSQNANANIYGNALEALFGAIYLDLGYRKCKFFVEKRIFCNVLNWDEIVESEINFKSKLLEWCQRYRWEVEFVLLEDTVVKNKHTFQTQLTIQGQEICEASGKSKKESQQKASKIALKKIQNEPNFLKKFGM